MKQKLLYLILVGVVLCWIIVVAGCSKTTQPINNRYVVRSMNTLITNRGPVYEYWITYPGDYEGFLYRSRTKDFELGQPVYLTPINPKDTTEFTPPMHHY